MTGHKSLIKIQLMVEAVNYEIDDLILYLYSLKHLSASLSAVLSHIMIVVIGNHGRVGNVWMSSAVLFF